MKTLDSVLAERDELQARATALEAALRALVQTEPTYDDEGVGTRCCYCAARQERLTVYSTIIQHKEDCPWRRARALLAEQDARAGARGEEGENERLQRVEHAARRFFTFTHGGYRWEATDEKRDALYDALTAK